MARVGLLLCVVCVGRLREHFEILVEEQQQGRGATTTTAGTTAADDSDKGPLLVLNACSEEEADLILGQGAEGTNSYDIVHYCHEMRSLL